MSVREIYLDNHATTPCDPRVVEAMLPTFTEAFGNAGSREHETGRQAAKLVDLAREQCAALIGASASEIVFTSGATESNNLAIKGVLAPKPGHVVTTQIEHKAVLDPCGALERAGHRVTYVAPGTDGVVRTSDIAAAIEDDTVLVSTMFANNEVGTIQPVAEIGALCKDRDVIFHCDAVQALAHLDCDVEALGIDLLSISAHKIYGPKGVGALFVRRRRPHVRLTPLVDGGGQERGWRSGTLNVSGIVGLGKAADLALAEHRADGERLACLRDRLLSGLCGKIPEMLINGSMAERLPNNLHVSLPGTTSYTLLSLLEGLAISSGSACTSASVDGSYVLRAMEVEPDFHATLRFGLGRPTTAEDIDEACGRVARAFGEARLRSRDDSGCGDSCS